MHRLLGKTYTTVTSMREEFMLSVSAEVRERSEPGE
jgi:hypothetical protein